MPNLNGRPYRGPSGRAGLYQNITAGRGRWSRVADAARGSFGLPDYYSETASISTPPEIDPNDKNYAKKTRSWLTWAQYNDYKRRFLPEERQLLDDVSGEKLLNDRLASIRQQAKYTMASTQGRTQRQLARYGVQQDSRERQASMVESNLSGSAAEAAAENLTRQHISDRNMQIISGSPTRQAIFTG